MLTSAVTPSFFSALSTLSMLASDLVGIGARGAQDRAAAEVDAADVFDGQLVAMVRVALSEPFVAVADADDLKALVDAFDRCGADYAVDAGGRAAADQNRHFAFFLRSCHIKFQFKSLL